MKSPSEMSVVHQRGEITLPLCPCSDEFTVQCINDIILQNIFIDAFYMIIWSCHTVSLSSPLAISVFTVISGCLKPTFPPILFHKSISLTALNLRHRKHYNDFLSWSFLFSYTNRELLQYCVGLLSSMSGLPQEILTKCNSGFKSISFIWDVCKN